MAKVEMSAGDIVDYTNAGALIKSGSVVVLGTDFCGVAMIDIDTDQVGAVAVEGAADLASTGAINFGDRVGVAATGDPVSTGGAHTVGVCIRAAASNVCRVKLIAAIAAS